MSYGFTVELNAFIDTEFFLKTVKSVAKEVTQSTKHSFEVSCQFISSGVMAPTLPSNLRPEDGALMICISSPQTSCESSQVTVMVMRRERDECESDFYSDESMYATVAVFGGGGQTKARLVTAAVCAIALAEQSNSLVVDELRRWSSKQQVSPLSLLEELKCQEAHPDIEAAFSEVLSNIERSSGRPL